MLVSNSKGFTYPVTRTEPTAIVSMIVREFVGLDARERFRREWAEGWTGARRCSYESVYKSTQWPSCSTEWREMLSTSDQEQFLAFEGRDRALAPEPVGLQGALILGSRWRCPDVRDVDERALDVPSSEHWSDTRLVCGCASSWLGMSSSTARVEVMEWMLHVQ